MDTKLPQTSQDIKDNIRDIQKEIFFLRKVEKLTSALYKVTELMPSEEPLKWKMRNEALELLSSAMTFIDHRRHTTVHDLSVILHKSSCIISLLEVSYMGSFVSQMNFKVLKGEYDALSDSIRNYKTTYEVPHMLSVARQDIEKQKETHMQEGIKRTFIKDIKDKDEITHEDIGDSERTFRVDHLRTQPTQSQRSYTKAENKHMKRSGEGGSRNAEEKQKRRDIILSFIKQKGEEVSIKDIFELPELSSSYSEKTIQRELVDMVNQGVLKKKGERRWSRYFV